MTKNYEIVLNYIKDLSVEIPDAETFLVSRENITKYTLGLNISTNPIKDQTIEVITNLNYKDKSENKKKSYFEISYATVIKLKNKEIKKDELERIILCDLQNEIYPDLEKLFLKILHGSGYDGLEFNKKVDFEELYKNNRN